MWTKFSDVNIPTLWSLHNSNQTRELFILICTSLSNCRPIEMICVIFFRCPDNHTDLVCDRRPLLPRTINTFSHISRSNTLKLCSTIFHGSLALNITYLEGCNFQLTNFYLQYSMDVFYGVHLFALSSTGHIRGFPGLLKNDLHL